jgi:hypothetical protein
MPKDDLKALNSNNFSILTFETNARSLDLIFCALFFNKIS